MDLDEMLAVMAAPIYASSCNRFPPQNQEHRLRLMQEALKEARMIWEMARHPVRVRAAALNERSMARMIWEMARHPVT
jgi:cytochrome c556